MTQNERIVELLRLRGDQGVTPLEALHLAGSLRLAARINDIRNPVNRLIRPEEEVVTDYVSRDGKTYARYVLRRRIEQAGLVQETLW